MILRGLSRYFWTSCFAVRYSTWESSPTECQRAASTKGRGELTTDETRNINNGKIGFIWPSPCNAQCRTTQPARALFAWALSERVAKYHGFRLSTTSLAGFDREYAVSHLHKDGLHSWLIKFSVAIDSCWAPGGQSLLSISGFVIGGNNFEFHSGALVWWSSLKNYFCCKFGAHFIVNRKWYFGDGLENGAFSGALITNDNQLYIVRIACDKNDRIIHLWEANVIRHPKFLEIIDELHLCSSLAVLKVIAEWVTWRHFGGPKRGVWREFIRPKRGTWRHLGGSHVVFLQ